MFDELTMGQLRSQIEQHLLMVEEVLGGMDTFIQRLEKRVSRIEEGLGIEPEPGVLLPMSNLRDHLVTQDLE